MDSETVLVAALGYAARGWFVVPVVGVRDGRCRCRRAYLCANAGKHPNALLSPQGLKNASRSAKTIERWFSMIPVENIGIVTGPSELVVLDVDPRNGGDESLARLRDLGLDLPPTLQATTGGGGLHFVYADADRLGRSFKPAPGLDVIGGNAYFVVAPSTHRSGRTYQWVDDQVEPVLAPTWLLDGAV